MFVTNNILNFEALVRKSIFAFTSRLSISNNVIIGTIKKSWIIRKQFGNHGQISCIYEHRLFYLSLYFREVDIVFFYPCILYTVFYYLNLCKYCNYGPCA